MTANPRVVAAILRSDLYSFIQAIFPIVSSNDEFAANWHIEAIAYQLMCILESDLKRLIITMPPRSLKSICASVAFPAFVLGHNPKARTNVFALMRDTGQVEAPAESKHQEPLTADDQAVIADFLQRNQSSCAEPHEEEPADKNSTVAAKKAKP